MNTTKETVSFSVGEMVTWVSEPLSPSVRDVYEKNLQDYGEGPFRVASIIPVPVSKCACGFYHSDPLHGIVPREHCTQTMGESVGHHQWLVIEKDGKIVMSNLSPDRPLEFSGAWFVKV